MSKICRTFAPDLITIMKKRTYIQPEVEVAVMPKYAIMAWQNSPGVSFNPAPSWRPKNPTRTPVF